MLTTLWARQIAHLPKWANSGVAAAPSILAVRQKPPPQFSLVHWASLSAKHNQLARGAAGHLMAERELIGNDKLVLRGLQFHGFHGVNQEEKTLGQKFVVDVDAWMDLSTAGETDSISDTVSYTDIYRMWLKVHLRIFWSQWLTGLQVPHCSISHKYLLSGSKLRNLMLLYKEFSTI
ncbi:unnamed protein product [Urochloa humidicola]